MDNIYTDDTWQYAIMSYFAQYNYDGGTFDYVISPQMADIYAIQSIYGSVSTRAGDTTYGFDAAGTAGAIYDFSSYSGLGTPAFTIYDSGGRDWLNASGYSNAQTLDLRPGHWSSIGGYTYNIGIYLTTIIEYAVGGSGDDTLYGNTANNSLYGNGGFDTVVFAGNRSAFSFSEFDNHEYNVTGNAQGTDALFSIERFVFNDVTVTDDHVAGTSTASVLAPAGSVTGDRQFNGDHDWFRATLYAGHSYVIDERGSPSGAGTLADSLATLRDSGGTEIAYNDDGGIGFDSQMAVHVATTGTYYLDASAFSAALGTYTLELEDLGMVNTRFQVSHVELNSFGPHAGGWMSQDATPRMLGQANTDFGDFPGLSDIFGFGSGGVYVALAHNGGFSNPGFVLHSFGSSAAGGGWSSQDLFPREVAQVDATYHDDIVGFGSGGVYVALGNGENSWALPTFTLHSFGASAAAGGWTSQDHLPRLLADVNLDGRADIVGFGSGGVYVALNTGGANFANPFLSTHSFGSSAAAGGWSSQNVAPRALADVNGDGYNDIVGFGTNATYVALGTGGGHFGPAMVALHSFGSSPAGGGWTDNNTLPRELVDINTDGRADIVGFGGGYVYYALGQSDGTFSLPVRDIHSFGPQSGGWSSQDLYPRFLGDVTGDHQPDIIAFGDSGVYVSRDFDFINV